MLGPYFHRLSIAANFWNALQQQMTDSEKLDTILSMLSELLEKKKASREATRQRVSNFRSKKLASPAQMIVTVTKKPVTVTRPTLEEVGTYCSSEAIPAADAEWFFWKCEGNDWTNGGKPIKNWKATLKAWRAAKYLPSQKGPTGFNNRPHVPRPDPKGAF